MAPVRNSPAVTVTRPPRAALQAAMAFRNASVQSVLLSPTAPNFVMSKSRLGNLGGLILARVSGNACQGSFVEDGRGLYEPTAAPNNAGLANNKPEPTPPGLRKSRRVFIE